jgi:peptidoglycan/xylan/chitin deacetylase (PgdA/CDA1 family)
MTFVAERTSTARRIIPRVRSVVLLIFAAWLLCPAFLHPGSSPANHRISVPILVYHRFGPVAANNMTVTIEVFRSQMKQLAESGYTVISLQRLVAYLSGTADAPPVCSVVITADDGHRSIYTDMAPVVERYGVPVTLFVYPSAISNAAWALTWEQLEELKATGLFDIQSHTFWHPNFQRERQRLGPADYERFVKSQLTRSKAILEQRLQIRVDMLAWPFGIYDDELIRQARQAGYQVGLTLNRFPATEYDHLMALPRYLITNADRGPALERILACRSER